MLHNKTQVFEGEPIEMDQWTCDSCGEKTVWHDIAGGYPDSMSGWESTDIVKAGSRHICPHCAHLREMTLELMLPKFPHRPVMQHPLERKCLDDVR